MTSNTEIIRNFYESYNRKDLTVLSEILSPDIEIMQVGELPWSGHFQGSPGVREFMAKLFAQIDSTFKIENLFDAGMCVVVTGKTVGIAKNSGKNFEVDAVHIWALEAEKIAKFEVYIDTPKMLEVL